MFRKYGSVSSFIAPSRFLLSKHQEFGFDTRKFVYIPNHIPLNDTAPSHQVGRHFLYFGRISREKGLRTLIKAYAKLQADLPLFIAGDGIDRSAMENMVAHEQNAQIKFIGYLTTEPLGRAIDEARAVILPSECYENAPMTILESFARGKPVIGARIGGIPEMINDGVNGYLFQPGNATDLQKKLVMFLNLPTRTVLEMGLAARKKVENEYSSESHYDRLMNVYLNVAQR
jgi:glycosyltransferase involved in cell wall biosynthesis